MFEGNLSTEFFDAQLCFDSEMLLHNALNVPFPVVDIWYYLVSWVYMAVNSISSCSVTLLYRKKLFCVCACVFILSFLVRVNDSVSLRWSLVLKNCHLVETFQTA